MAHSNDDDPTRLLRFPDIHGDRLAFVYAGDIYTASSDGGTAFRLTSHEGRELFPKFSPDGSRIAFSAEYNGTRQVFVAGTAQPLFKLVGTIAAEDQVCVAVDQGRREPAPPQ